MKTIKRFLPHLCLILSGTFITFYILDLYNPEMAFINNDVSKLMLLILCLVSITVGVIQILQNRREVEEDNFLEDTMVDSEETSTFLENGQEPASGEMQEPAQNADYHTDPPMQNAAYYAAPPAGRLVYAGAPAAALPTQDSKAALLFSKVPEVTIFFWIIKILCTTVGETLSDFLNVNLNFGLVGTTIVMGILFAVVLFFQFRAKRYIPSLYWATVVLISIFGTLVTDNMTDGMGVPLEVSTIGFSILLVLTFAAWYFNEKTLSIHSIYTKRREAFYWLTILFTFALGTASGDLVSEGLGVGYLKTGLLVCAVVVLVATAWKMKLNADLSFWLVYIMTRPLGASLGDYLSQPSKFGGLGLGATVTSIIFVGAILLTVLFLTITKKDQVGRPQSAVSDEPPQKGFLTQTVAVICVFALVGGAGYYWRHNALLNQGDSSATQAGSQASAQTDDPEATAQGDLTTSNLQQTAQGDSAASTQPGSTETASPTSAVQTKPAATPNAKNTKLGDLSSFLAIEQDMLKMVNTGDLAGAKNRADDLEFTWDNAQSSLKPKDQKKWTEIDKTLDALFRQVRAVKPTVDGCKKALSDAISALEQ